MPANAPLTDETTLFDFRQGDSPLVIAAPHVGTFVPADIAAGMTAKGRSVNETDFHVNRLFDYAAELGATTLSATHSRFVIDLNRAPDGQSLYPGRFETALCPVSDFDHNALYLPDQAPDDAEIARRRSCYWQPYHDRLHDALKATVKRHGHALLIDAHSIRPSIPSLFDGRLPDLSFGTHDGRTLRGRPLEALQAWRAGQTRYSHTLDGRFKGGYTTRHYGTLSPHILALQIEIVQDTYLDLKTPHLYDPGLAQPLSLALRPLVEALIAAL